MTGKKRKYNPEIGAGPIRKNIRDGWRYSIKKVGKYSYIRRRRSGDKDVQVARFDPKLWAYIERIQAMYADVPRGKLVEQAQKQVQEAQTRIKQTTCAHILNSWCHYWKYPNTSSFIKIFERLGDGESQYGVKDVDERSVIVKAQPFVCTPCSSFSPD